MNLGEELVPTKVNLHYLREEMVLKKKEKSFHSLSNKEVDIQEPGQ